MIFDFEELLPFILGLLLFALGIACSLGYQKWRLRTYQQLANALLAQSEKEANAHREQAKLAAQNELMQQRLEMEVQRHDQERKWQKEGDRLKEREDKLEKRLDLAERKLVDIDRREASIQSERLLLEQEKKQAVELSKALTKQLEQSARLTTEEARDTLLHRLQLELGAESAKRIQQAQEETEQQAERLAKTIIATAINRLCVPCISETTITTVAIPSDEIKGRIIGREGRNIRHLERLTGINFLIDDTPGAVVLSGFDPVRKQIAKMALTELVQDGRIHPTRIEESVSKAHLDVDRQIRRAGEEAAMRSGVLGLHLELLLLLGKLQFRRSYGQNILEHSLEVSHLLGLMAAELGLNVPLAKRIGLLHDIGKAVSHEIEGSHAMVGHDLALKYGEKLEVACGIGCHHGEMAPLTVEGSLCSAADALSAARPGGRVEAIEECLKRLKRLEEIAKEFSGVDQAYALRAGREVHVSVLPNIISDDAMVHLARDLTRRIQTELTYPDKIKVMLIRERRVIDYAI